MRAARFPPPRASILPIFLVLVALPAAVSAALDISGFQTAWQEEFDNGAGRFSNRWGPGTDESVAGQITVWTSADNQDSGMETQPDGYGTPAGGWGFGLYSFTLKTQGTIGVYALLWPGSNVWPGPELDLIEINDDGQPYSTVHWRGDDGSNQFTSYVMADVDPAQTHTYALLWQQGRLTMFVDGDEKWSTSEHVPNDYAHGGENLAPGIGAQTSWNRGALGGANYITLYSASYMTPAADAQGSGDSSAPGNAGDATDGAATTGDATDGAATTGDATDGAATTGDATDGAATTGDATDGAAPTGDATDGAAPTGDATDGAAPTGDATDGATTTGDATDAAPTTGDASNGGGAASGDAADGTAAGNAGATAGDAADGATTTGDATDGATTSGDATDGAGATTTGDATDGATTNGDATDGATTNGDATDGATTTGANDAPATSEGSDGGAPAGGDSSAATDGGSDASPADAATTTSGDSASPATTGAADDSVATTGSPADDSAQPATSTTGGVTAPNPGMLDLSNFDLVWQEEFDNGAGRFSNRWGPGTDESVAGQITVWTSADNQDSGMETQPDGYGTPAGGWGFGLYTFTLKTQGTIGVYALLWPGSNVWPGPELDLIEINDDGQPYSTVHWRGDDGSNQFTSYVMADVDPAQTHTYALLWQQGRLTMFVDGDEKWSTEDHVPNDYAHGGENLAPGIGAQTSWNRGALGGANYITLYSASYMTLKFGAEEHDLSMPYAAQTPRTGAHRTRTLQSWAIALIAVSVAAGLALAALLAVVLHKRHKRAQEADAYHSLSVLMGPNATH